MAPCQPISCEVDGSFQNAHLLGTEPVAVGDSLIEPSCEDVFVVLSDGSSSFPYFWPLLLLKRQRFQGCLQLIDCFGFGDGWLAVAEIQHLCSSLVMLGFFSLSNEDKRFDCL